MSEIRLFRFNLPLRPPIELRGSRRTVRSGLLLRRSVNGVVHWGEAAPLPNFSVESLDRVIAAAIAGDWSRAPSLEFGFKSLDMFPSKLNVPLNALLMGTAADIQAQAIEMASSRVQAVKLKVGRSDAIDDEIELTRNVRTTLRRDQTLRLDANRAWSYESAIRFLDGVRDLAIEYIEEPCRDPMRLESLFKTSGVNYALDETLLESTTLERFPNVGALIVKPTLLGYSVVKELAQTGIPLVFSASFESGVGIGHIAEMADRFADGRPIGIDTYRWLGRDVLVKRHRIEDGEMQISSDRGVDSHILTEITP